MLLKGVQEAKHHLEMYFKLALGLSLFCPSLYSEWHLCQAALHAPPGLGAVLKKGFRARNGPQE